VEPDSWARFFLQSAISAISLPGACDLFANGAACRGNSTSWRHLIITTAAHFEHPAVRSRQFIILDRDGTIIVERNYLSHPDQVELIPHAADGLAHLATMGLGLVVVTNQSGIGRGYFDEARLAQIHRRMCEMLAGHGVFLDRIYVCPHTPEDDCDCRKPRTHMIASAAAEFGFDPAEAFVIGDKPCDIELGRRVGAKTFLVRTGYGAECESAKLIQPNYVVDDLLDAARIIMRLNS
jgi:D-glycero-D-manno-heptose 1,7-bisphosphate phosphatase